MDPLIHFRCAPHYLEIIGHFLEELVCTEWMTPVCACHVLDPLSPQLRGRAMSFDPVSVSYHGLAIYVSIQKLTCCLFWLLFSLLLDAILPCYFRYPIASAPEEVYFTETRRA